MQNLDQLKKAIQSSHKIVFFGGAGVSTASGIPDFRSANGIFHQPSNCNVSPETIISHSFFINYPKDYFEFHFDKLVYENATPNITHHYLKQLENMGKDVKIVTQNIDGLHQKAGSTQVFELHGNVQNNYCMTCGKYYDLKDLNKDHDGIPRCPVDNGIVRPDIVMYEEPLNQETIENAVKAISEAELLIVAGTSLSVYPAASFIQYFRGQHFVIINKSKLNSNHRNAIIFEEDMTKVFESLK
ncbi:NAD-dependent protein deacylase [Macrococcus sp. DPC7161]|uniref:NAD-dependent protein deacylase n=1 Tax=Macrococcus sp. DPC7161 TaxID=2507060 RepID=UPI00197BDB21|nr:NAD-dependent protein deacylase [Macrococcus sp. DPC7161]